MDFTKNKAILLVPFLARYYFSVWLLYHLSDLAVIFLETQKGHRLDHIDQTDALVAETCRFRRFQCLCPFSFVQFLRFRMLHSVLH